MVSILLAAYNGERHIARQLDSLLAQKERDFRIFIRDDRSSDATFRIAREYAANNPERIFAVQNDVNSGGSRQNFLRMIAEYRDDYLMLCDQDDVWLPEKIGTELAKMREMECRHGKDTPLLVHSGLRVVDERLTLVSPGRGGATLARQLNIDPEKTALHELLVQNVLTGCTILYNRALAELVAAGVAAGGRQPETADKAANDAIIMHDWWLGLVASAFGRIAYIREPLILYRQHAQNAVGSKNTRSLRYIAARLLNSRESREVVRQTYRQAEYFLRVYQDRLSPEQTRLVRAYAAIPNIRGKIGRIRAACALRTLKHGAARRLAHLFFL
ncbi:MAG: glycosyltransferase family 2 protein [Clostridiales bacterium]|jgi:glycosyltransferase involved in cell wall biosynthesis|nr:glycosyltransferase family 2 protein [Clostridiales bacterium]